MVSVSCFHFRMFSRNTSGSATGGQEGAIAPGRQSERRQRRVVAAKEGGDKYDISGICPGRQKPWRRHCVINLVKIL
jgi:hypothetical protein